MAASGYTPISIYHSTTASAVPVNTNLVNGELAINITDGKLYYKDNGGTVQIIASKGTGTIGGSTTQVQYNLSGALAGSSNFVFDGTTATINTLNLTNALGATYGGTAQSSWTTGDLLYASGSNTLAKLGIGLNTYILTSNGSIPGWAAPSAISVNTATNLAGGAAGSVPYQSGVGATTFLSIGTANQVVTSTGSAPQWSSGLSITTLTASNAVTFSATTQNIALGTSQTSGTFTVGGAAQTGNIVVDQSTKTHTLNIGTGITESGQTKTINIGTAGDTGSTTAITIGSANGTTITVNGTVNASTLDLTNLEVTNIKAKDGTASMTLADTTGIITFSATAGTANGVLYLNGSRAVTSGSALTFDGTNFYTTAQLIAGAGSANANVVARSNVANGGAGFSQFLFGNTSSDSRGYLSYSHAADSILFGSAGGTRMTLNDSGNLGIGVAPSTWGASFKVLQIGSASSFYNLSQNTIVGNNIFNDGTLRYLAAGFGTFYVQNSSGEHAWWNAPNWNGSGSNIASFSQAMTLDASGRLLIGGTSSPASSNIRLLLQSPNATSDGGAQFAYNGGGGGGGAIFSATGSGLIFFGYTGVVGSETYTERARIDSSGTLILRQSSNAANTSVSFNTTVQNALTLDSDGDLGIGVATPAYRLSVQGSPELLADLYSTSAGFNTVLQFRNNNSANGRFGYYNGNFRWSVDNGVTQNMSLTSSGNLGIGETNPTQKLHVAGNGRFVGGAGVFFELNNGTDASYISQESSAELRINQGTASSNSKITFLTQGSERARITAGGDFGIGTTNPSSKFEVRFTGNSYGYFSNTGDNNTGVRFQNTGRDYAIFVDGGSGSGNPLRFYDFTAGTERARITSGGYFKASNDGTYAGSTGSYHELRQSSDNADIVQITSTAASSPYGIYQKFSAASPDNNTNYFLRCDDSTTARCYIYSDGDLANHDGVYGTISDQKLKQDIVDAGSQWDDIKAIRFRKYRMKSDVAVNPDAPALLGVIAQELEQVSPGLVDEHPDMETVEVTDEDGNVTQTQQPTGTTTKTVKSSILLMKAAVALQEAMARIEQLEAKVAALEAK